MNVSILLTALVTAGPCGAGEAPSPDGAKRPPARLNWLGLEEGLRILRKEYRPIALRYRPATLGGAAEGREAVGPAAALEKLLGSPEVEKELQNFICVDLPAGLLDQPYPIGKPPSAVPAPGSAPPKGKPAEPREGKEKPEAPAPPIPVAPPISSRLRLVEDLPALLILDYREQVARRYQEKLPAREALRKELARLAREIRSQALEARRVEKLLEESRYSHALGETRQAVLGILPLDDSRARRGLDQELAGRVQSVIDGYKKEARAMIAGGEALETQKRFLDAAEIYRRAARNFPFPEIVKIANQRETDAMRKERGGL